MLRTLEQKSIFFTADAGKHPSSQRSSLPDVSQHAKRSVARAVCRCSVAPSTFFMLDFVSIPECEGGPSPLPAPEEMENIPTVISIMAVALERLIRREGATEKKRRRHLEAAVIDDGLRSTRTANHGSIRQKRNRPERAQVGRRRRQARTDSFKLIPNVSGAASARGAGGGTKAPYLHVLRGARPPPLRRGTENASISPVRWGGGRHDSLSCTSQS